MMFALKKLCRTVVRILRRSRRQRCHHFRHRHPADHRLRRSGGRLQPRQLGQGRHADGARFDRADAVERSGHRHRRSIEGERVQVFHLAVRCGRKPRTSRSTSTYTTRRRLQDRDQRHGSDASRFHQAPRLRQLHHAGVLHRQMGHEAPARCARARQHRDRWPTTARWPL